MKIQKFNRQTTESNGTLVLEDVTPEEYDFIFQWVRLVNEHYPFEEYLEYAQQKITGVYGELTPDESVALSRRIDSDKKAQDLFEVLDHFTLCSDFDDDMCVDCKQFKIDFRNKYPGVITISCKNIQVCRYLKRRLGGKDEENDGIAG